MKNEAAELVIASTASKSTYAGAASMFFGWLASSEAAIVIGMIVGVAGLLVNWYYKAKSDRRQTVEHELRAARLRRGMTSDTDLGELGRDD